MTSIATNVTAAGNRYTSQTFAPGSAQPQASDASAAGATPIPHIGKETVALVTSTSVNGTETNDGTTITNTGTISGVSLPASAAVGDAVVVIQVGGESDVGLVDVWVPVGHYLGTLYGPQLNAFSDFNGSGVYQMVSPGVWYKIA